MRHFRFWAYDDPWSVNYNLSRDLSILQSLQQWTDDLAEGLRSNSRQQDEDEQRS